MRQTAKSSLTTELHCERTPPLQAQIDAAVRDQTTPISRLLKLMAALDAEANIAKEKLRGQLRARIGAPLPY